MPRLMPPAPASGNHYRNFAIGVLAVAAIMAVASDGSSGEALVPETAHSRPEQPVASAVPASGLAARHGETAWASGSDESEIAAEIATMPENGDDAAEAAEAGGARPAGPPKAGKRGPADRPTPEQLTMLLAASRERSGAPPDGD